MRSKGNYMQHLNDVLLETARFLHRLNGMEAKGAFLPDHARYYLMRGIARRTHAITEATLQMIEMKNQFVSIALVRMNLENLMVFHAAEICEQGPAYFAVDFLSSSHPERNPDGTKYKRLDGFRDKNGDKLTYTNLARSLDFEEVYKFTNGFIHTDTTIFGSMTSGLIDEDGAFQGYNPDWETRHMFPIIRNADEYVLSATLAICRQLLDGLYRWIE